MPNNLLTIKKIIMKKYTIVIMFLFYIITGFSQPTTVPTCENNPVYASLRDELEDIQAANDLFLQTYGPMFGFTQANIIDDASNTYNCHAYAYHVSEGGNKVWISNAGNNDFCDAPLLDNIDQYWEDGCIIQVTNESDAEKVHYYRGDHSAIRLSDGMYNSKWGNYPLIKHAATSVDYCDPVDSRRYYSSFIVDALNDYVCYGNNATFTTPDYVDCTYYWTYNTNLLDYVSGQGTKTFVVEPKTSSSQGEAWVKLELTIDLDPDVTREITKTIWVGKPRIYAYGNYIVDVNTGMPVYDLCYGTHNDVEAVYPTDVGITDWDWRVSHGQVYSYGMLDQYATIYPNDYQSFMLEIRACNTCGYSDWAHMYTNVINCSSYYLMMSPNPTTGETILSIESESEEKTLGLETEWELEIYSPTQILKQKETNLRGNNITIQTQGWPEGIYMVRVKYKDEILTGKLVVKKYVLSLTLTMGEGISKINLQRLKTFVGLLLYKSAVHAEVKNLQSLLQKRKCFFNGCLQSRNIFSTGSCIERLATAATFNFAACFTHNLSGI